MYFYSLSRRKNVGCFNGGTGGNVGSCLSKQVFVKTSTKYVQRLIKHSSP